MFEGALESAMHVVMPTRLPVKEPNAAAAKPHHRVPPEQFFGYIAGFLDMVKDRWNEIESNPARWRQFFTSADGCKGVAESFARHVSESAMEPGKDGDMSPRKRSSASSNASVVALPSPRKSAPREQTPPKVGQLSPRRLALGHSPEAAPLSPRTRQDSSPKALPLSPRGFGRQDSPKVPTVPEEKEVPETTPRRRRRGATPRGSVEEMAGANPTTPRVRPPAEDIVNHASPPAKVPPKVPKLNLKRQSPRAVSRKWSDLPDTDRSLKGFLNSVNSPVNKPQHSPKHVPHDPLSGSSSSASVYGDKAFAEDSASSSTETDGEVEVGPPGVHEQGYASTSASSDTGPTGRESPASASSPNFSPMTGTLALTKVPPLKMSKVFGPRGVTPSFGPGAIVEKPAEVKKGPDSPRRLLSARSGEDTGTARKIGSHRSQKAEPLEEAPEAKQIQTCEFHQMNDSTDCEYHKLADSDTDMTQSDEEFEMRRKSISSAA
ncbi:hypothetical protein AK812_SmicGene12265 [Symbiodinium microadriaticum]|uniref:Uncharacterized protein n=1 Tax=Symbiodinium microadriaticum TaxID=2951 RepID=A0A1Q9EB56_SYMMI|nr:hypothetical protein AK812_SmicGene12265 [Symbiodinium microadriaticum]